MENIAEKYFIFTANSSSKYNHKAAFDKFGYIDWKQPIKNKCTVGDIVFIYVTDPDKKIRYKTIITETDLTESTTDEFWIEPNHNGTNNKFCRVKFLKSIDSDALCYKYLLENGIATLQPSNQDITNNVKLVKYINSIFDKSTKITYLSEITAALKALGGIGSLSDITEQIEDRNLLKSIKTNPAWKRNVSAEIQKHCKETQSYIEGNENLFYSVEGIGKGIWGLIGYEPVDDEIIDTPQADTYDKEKFLENVYLDEKDYNKLCSILSIKKNIILQGAPGVGKTFAAKRLAYSIIGAKDDSKVKCIQFHQSYSYEDFIEGFRPKEDGGFELQKGIFRKFCLDAAGDPANKYFFIIDEINRGNLSRIFGELLMLIEADKRGEDNSIELVYSHKAFYVPENVYIIGMMNTADRSLAMLDYALRRRFAFYSMKPAFNQKKFIEYSKKIKCDMFGKAVAAIKSLNKIIYADKSLGAGFEIGHSYFCFENYDLDDITDDTIKNIIRYEIIPTIEEYWFDNENRLEEERTKLNALIGD